MEKYITQKPARSIPPGLGVYLILDENKERTTQLTCGKEYYERLTKEKNLEPIPWADFILSARFPTTPESPSDVLSCKFMIVEDGEVIQA